MGRMVHFEVTAEDTARARKFYEIFGWKSSRAMEDIDYWVVKTGEGGIGIDGAIMSREYNAQPVIHWAAVDDLDAMIEKVKTAGGKVVGEKQKVPGIGDTIYVSDTEGNNLGMIQALPRENNEKIIREYYAGWEKSDWEVISSKLADDFTFTSPFDDHLDTATYKARCWKGADSIHKYDFLTIMEDGNEAFARWNCEISGKTARNTEYFLFENGKIKTIEVYFGKLMK